MTEPNVVLERLTNLTFALKQAHDGGQWRSAEWIHRNVAGYTTLSATSFESTFRKDRLALTKIGVPIATHKDEDGRSQLYQLKGDEYGLAEIEFTQEEAAVVALAGSVGLSRDLSAFARSGWTKIAAAGVRRAGTTSPASLARGDLNAMSPALVDTITAAIDRGATLTFTYTRHPGAAPVTRHLDPWALVPLRQKIYLTGFDLDRGEPRSFRTSRIEDVRAGQPHSAQHRIDEGTNPARVTADALAAMRSIISVTATGSSAALAEFAVDLDHPAYASADDRDIRGPLTRTFHGVDRAALIAAAAAAAPDVQLVAATTVSTPTANPTGLVGSRQLPLDSPSVTPRTQPGDISDESADERLLAEVHAQVRDVLSSACRFAQATLNGQAWHDAVAVGLPRSTPGKLGEESPASTPADSVEAKDPAQRQPNADKANAGRANAGTASAGTASAGRANAGRATRTGRVSRSVPERLDDMVRMLNLIPYFTRRPGASVMEAAHDLGRTPAEIMDDLNRLWCCGMPGMGPGDLVDLEHSYTAVTVTDAQGLTAPLRLTRLEASVLLLALETVESLPELGLADIVSSAANKLRAIVPTGTAIADIDGRQLPQTTAASAEVLQSIRHAQEHRKVLDIDYVDAEGHRSTRRVHPVTVFAVGSETYLRAAVESDELNPADFPVRTFRLDRIIRADLTMTPVADGIVTAAEHLDSDDPFGFSATGEQILVLLRADKAWLSDRIPMDLWVLQDSTESHSDVPGGLTTASTSTLPEGFTANSACSDSTTDVDDAQWLGATISVVDQEWFVELLLSHGDSLRLVDRKDIAHKVVKRGMRALTAYAE